MQRKYFLFVSLVLGLIIGEGLGEDYFVSVGDGADSNACTDQNNACASLGGVMKKITGQKQDVQIFIMTGVYVGENNIDVTFSSNTSFTLSANSSVIFDCEMKFNQIFQISSGNLTLQGLTLQNCPLAVSHTDKTGDITLSNTTIIYCNYSLELSSRIVEADNVYISTSGSHSIQGSARRLSISNSVMESASVMMNVSLNNPVTLSDSQFKGNILIDTTTSGTVSDCLFQPGSGDLYASPIMQFRGSDAWQISDIEVECNSNVYDVVYISNDSLYPPSSIERAIIQNCLGGVTTYGNVIMDNISILSSSFGFMSSFATDIIIRNSQIIDSIEILEGGFASGGVLIGTLCVSETTRNCSVILENTQFIRTQLLINSYGNNSMVSCQLDSTYSPSFRSNGYWLFENNTFENVIPSRYYGGALTIGISYENPIVIKNSVFRNCSTIGGGGAISLSGGSLMIENSVFEDNEAVESSGGAIIALTFDSIIIKDSTFSGNAADTGGAVSILDPTGEVSISNCSFSGNNAVIDGGAVYAFTNLDVQHSDFVSNIAANGMGGGILASQFHTVTITGTSFTKNVAANSGGAIGLQYNPDNGLGGEDFEPTISITSCSFDQNQAKDGSVLGCSDADISLDVTLEDNTQTDNVNTEGNSDITCVKSHWKLYLGISILALLVVIILVSITAYFLFKRRKKNTYQIIA